MNHTKTLTITCLGIAAILVTTNPSSSPLPVLLMLVLGIFFIGSTTLNFILNKVLVVRGTLLAWVGTSLILCGLILRSLHQLSFLDGVLILSLATLLCWYLVVLKKHSLSS